MADELIARVALSMQYEPGGADLVAAVAMYGAAGVVGGRLDADHWFGRAAAQIRDCRDRGIDVLMPGAPGWPTQLDDLAAPPLVLYTLGAPLRPTLLRSVAIVGSRTVTTQGRQLAHSWAAQLTAQGLAVVSGAAFGIDAAAHSGALSAGRGTVAVLASGVDVPSPRGNAALLKAIARQGTIVSEVPPGTPPQRHRFITRNRLIAALTPGTLVVQAAARSGALATARQAADLNRVVMAVPGLVSSDSHTGCHDLIRDQVAVLVRRPQDVVELVLPLSEVSTPATQSDPQGSSTAR